MVSSPGFGSSENRKAPYSDSLSLRLPLQSKVRLAVYRTLAGSFFNRHGIILQAELYLFVSRQFQVLFHSLS
jgi:hypothetical protein